MLCFVFLLPAMQQIRILLEGFNFGTQQFKTAPWVVSRALLLDVFCAPELCFTCPVEKLSMGDQ